MFKMIQNYLEKDYFTNLLQDYGKVEHNKKLSQKVAEIDILFTPFSPLPKPPNNFALFEFMVNKLAIFETFSEPCTEWDIKDCLMRLFGYEKILAQNYVLGKRRSIKKLKYPCSWIITPSLDPELIEGFGISPSQKIKGLYFLPRLFRISIIAINELPVNPGTLWLRILQKGELQKQAIQELMNLPSKTPYRNNLLEILAHWYRILELREQLTLEEQEEMMNLSPIYVQERNQWLAKGKLQERQEMIENIFKVRFGTIDDDLARSIPQLLQLPNEELTRIMLTKEREELLDLCNKNER